MKAFIKPFRGTTKKCENGNLDEFSLYTTFWNAWGRKGCKTISAADGSELAYILTLSCLVITKRAHILKKTCS